MLKVNDTLPVFNLPDQNGDLHSSTEYKGKWLVVYFYPKDDTPGCTIEACSFRDSYQIFHAKQVVVVGISKDSVRSHQKFQTKYELPFTLLSDQTKETMKAFGVLADKKFMGKTYLGVLRTTFLINPKGVVAKVYEDVDPATHVETILEDINSKLLLV